MVTLIFRGGPANGKVVVWPSAPDGVWFPRKASINAVLLIESAVSDSLPIARDLYILSELVGDRTFFYDYDGLVRR